MDLISREEAKEKGLRRYFTGIPCKRGHIAERRVGSTYCLQCEVLSEEELRGKIKIYGVGYNSLLRGEDGFSSRPVGGIRREYDHWRRMLQRSYDPKWKEVHPTYEECWVNPSWHDYQDFASWYDSCEFKNITWDLDKDLLIVSNKEYGPDTCVFLPEEINKAIIIRGTGSHFRKRGKGTYEFYYRGKFLGCSSNPTEYSNKYIDAKLCHIRELAEKYKEVLDPRAYDALVNFKIGVIDEKGTLARLP